LEGKKIQKARVLICESTRHVLFLKKGKTAKISEKEGKADGSVAPRKKLQLLDEGPYPKKQTLEN